MKTGYSNSCQGQVSCQPASILMGLTIVGNLLVMAIFILGFWRFGIMVGEGEGWEGGIFLPDM